MKFKLKLIHNDVIRTLVKVKVTLEQATMAQRGSRCIALLCLQPRCQMGAGGQRHAPAAVPPGKSPVSIVQEAEWASGPVWTGRKDLAPPGFDPGPSSLQRVAVRTELKIKKYVCMYVCVCVYVYIVCSHKLRYTLLGTQFMFSLRIRPVQGGASRPCLLMTTDICCICSVIRWQSCIGMACVRASSLAVGEKQV